MSMGMGMGAGGHGGMGMGLMRSLRRDNSVLRQQLPKGIVRRIATFARPYKAALGIFLVLIIVDAVIGAANPLIYRSIIDTGIGKHPGHGRPGFIVELALIVGGLAVLDAVLSLWQRWVSARIGEGLIFDMRTRVFEHIQKMPIAFFTRTQTGALVSRLNNDVLGAQQAFTDTFSSVVSNVIGVAITLAAMFWLSWPITLVALALLPVFLVPARFVGRRLADITRESYTLNAQMTNTMTERFNVAGALLVKLFGHPTDEVTGFSKKAGRVRDIGVTQAMYTRVFMAALLLTASLATALVYGWGGVLAERGTLMIGTVVALTAYLARLYGPLTALSNVQLDVMTALVSFDRVFEVLDLPPMIDDKPDAVAIPRGPARIEFDHVDFGYPSAEEVSLASLESVAVLERTVSQPVLFDVSFEARPGQLVALVGPSGAGKTTISHLVPRLYDVRGGSVRINGVDVRDATLESVGAIVGVVTQDAHLFHETIRANLRYAKPDATDAELTERAERRPHPPVGGVASRRARHARRRPRLPALGWREAADRHRPAPPQGARHRRPRRSHRPSGLRVRSGRATGAQDRTRRSHVTCHRPPPFDGARGGRDPRHRGRAHRRAGSPRRSPRGGRAVLRALHHAIRVTGRPRRCRGGRRSRPRVRGREPGAGPTPAPGQGTGTGTGGVGPVYRADGRIRRLWAACSMTWAVHPMVRPAAKVGVNISRGRPQVCMTTPA